MKQEFKSAQQSVRWIAQQNENHFNFAQAAKLYREIGDEEDAKRCDEAQKRDDALMIRKTLTPPSTGNAKE